MNLTEFALDHPRFTAVGLLLVTLLGVVSFWTMPRAEDPQFGTSTVRVAAIYPGASPTDIESQVVDPIEDEVDDLEDIDQIESTIQDGVAVTSVEFQPSVSSDDAEEETQRAVSQVAGDLPGGVRDLSVDVFETTDVSIYQAALVSETASYPTLEDAAEQVKDRVERIGGVKEVETWAHPEQEVHVDLSLERLRETGLSLGPLTQRIQADAQNVPGGDLVVGRRQFNVQTTGDYASLDELRTTVVGQSGPELVHLDDVATVERATADVTHRARFNGTKAVFVTATQQTGSNIFAVTEAMKQSLDGIEHELPADVTLREVFDQSESVTDRVNGFFWNLLQGLLLIGGVVLLALGWRTSGIVLMAIPLSILITIYALDVTGVGLQQISIVGLIIALGLLVDDAIVVVERVARYRERGASIRDAVLESMDEVGGALVSTSATSILAFLPIVLVQSGSGDFIYSLPLTVVYALAASLLVTLTLTPLLAAYGLGGDRDEETSPDPAEGGSDNVPRTAGLLGWVLPSIADGAYRRVLRGALEWRWSVISIAVVALAGSVALFPLIGVSFFPKAEKPQFLVSVTTPEGASRAVTDRAVQRVEQWLDGREDVRRYAANVGRDHPMVYYNVRPRRERASVGQVYVEATNAERVSAIASALEADLDDVPGVEYNTEIFKNGPPVEAPVAIKLIGPELSTLRAQAADVAALIAETPGTRNVNNPLADRTTDLHVNVDRGQAGMLGVSPATVDRAVRMAVDGLPVGTYRDAEGDEHDIVVGLPGEPAATDLERLSVSSAQGAAVPLRQVAQVELKREPTRIDHFNTERAVTVTANVAPGRSAVEVTQAIVERLDDTSLPSGYRTFVGGELEAQTEGFGELLFALIGAVFGILAVLVLQFGSLRQAVIILTAVPLSVIGAFPALLLTGYTFSFTAFVGFTSLAGIVVNNSTLLVDYANQLRAEGYSLLDAAVEAGRTRFAPIVLTAVTTIGGVLPLTMSGSTLWGPLGWVLIGGLLVSTVLTLVVVPTLYAMLSR